MKDIFVILVILILIIGGSFWTHNFYESTMKEFEKKLNDLANDINIETNKEENIKKVENFWKSKEDILIIFQEHDSIDEIETHLYECIHYYRIEEKDHFDLAKSNLLKRMEDLVKREHLTLVNLF